METNVKYYKTAGITFQVISDFSIHEKTFHPKFELFETYGPGNDNIIIRHHFFSPDLSKILDSTEKVIYNQDQWKIVMAGNFWIYKYTPVYPEDIGYPAMGVFNKNHSLIDIYSPDISQQIYNTGQFEALTLFNSDQVLFSKLLCDRNGIIIHSNGFDIHGKGILLAGKSGAGKSTLSNMLKQNGFQIFCDDRMFVLKEKQQLNLHGNWCHGTVPDVSPGSVLLGSIFFLEQSKINSIEPLDDKKEILQEIIQSMVKPVLTGDGWGETLAVIDAIVSNIQCFRLKFDLSGNICDILTRIMDGIKLKSENLK